MVFSSIRFLYLFLPIFFLCYLAARPVERKNLVLLVFSLLFYGAGQPLFVLGLMASIAFNHRAALLIADREGPARKRATGLAIAANLALLAVFKYAVFAVDSMNLLLRGWGLEVPVPNIPLPLGISFFTFHAISYLVDVHRRQAAAERSLVNLAVYISMFPQLVAGPIVRFKTVVRRIHDRRSTLGRASAGARIFVIGLAQKMLLADELTRIVDAAFDGGPGNFWAPPPGIVDAWLGAIAYGLQIYFDFAGYSNMAIGLALILGFKFPRNFDMPYRSLSVTEFWRRWHMSLSAWFRDYLYIPLGGNRGSDLETYRNLGIVFLLCGLWHGASWNFVIWGAHHGAFLILERAGLGRWLRRAPAMVGWSYAMVAVFGGWVWFRAADLADALDMFRGLIGLNGWQGPSVPMYFALYPTSVGALILGAALAVLPARGRDHLRDEASRIGAIRRRLRRLVARPAVDTAGAFALMLLSLLAVSGGSFSPFLYFRF